MAGIRIHRLIATLTRGIQVLQQMAVDEPFRRKCKSVGWITVERGSSSSQRFGSLALAIFRPAPRHPEDVPVREPRSRGSDPAVPVDKFIEDPARLQELIFTGPVHELDTAKQ